MTGGETQAIDPSLVERVLAEALATGGDFADLFAEDRRATTFGMEDDRLDRLQLTQERGVGVRVVAGGVTGYAYADGWDEASMLTAARAARDVARGTGPSGQPTRLVAVDVGRSVTPQRPTERATIQERAELLERANAAAREAGPEVAQVTIRFSDIVQRVLIASSGGTLAEDERRIVQLMVAVTAEKNGMRQIGRRARGGQPAWSYSTCTSRTCSGGRQPRARSECWTLFLHQLAPCRSSSATAGAACSFMKRLGTGSKPTTSSGTARYTPASSGSVSPTRLSR